MKKVLVGSAIAAAILSASSASAADMAPRYTKAPVAVAIVYDWTGFYIGGNVGYSWGRAATDGTLTGTQSVSQFVAFSGALVPGFPVVTPLAALPLTGRANVDGFIGGGQAGYNWQREKWLFGLEGDLQYSDERGRAEVCIVAGCAFG